MPANRRIFRGLAAWLPCLVFASSLLVLPGCENMTVGVEVGKRAPDIICEDHNGKPVTLGQFHGKVVLIDFWATWCPPCVKSIPEERELFRQYDTRPFAMLGISRDKTREDLKGFLSQEKLPWPNIYDASGNISEQWNVRALPTFILIDHKGIVIGRWEGADKMSQIGQAIEKAVREADNK